MVRKALKTVFLSAAILLMACVSGCTMYMAAAFKYPRAEGADDGGSQAVNPAGVSSSAAEVTLAWDPPPSAIASYKLFFRIHDTAGWYSLVEGVAADPAPEYTVQHSALGSGIFDFGVVAVNTESAESSMHVSLQTTAEPETGWYLVWGD